MSESTLDKAKSREAVLNMTLKDVLNELKDGLDTAEKYGGSCAIVQFANEINFIENMIDSFMAIDEETEGLITEQYAKSKH